MIGAGGLRQRRGRPRGVPRAADRDDGDPRARREHRRSPTSLAWRTSTPATRSCRASSRSAGTASSSRTASSRSRSPPRSSSSLFQADVTRLIPFYAIGVFTSFTLSQAGHGQAPPAAARARLAARPRDQRVRRGRDRRRDHRDRGHEVPARRRAIIVLVPVMVWLLVRMNHQYEREHAGARRGARRRSIAERPGRPIAVLLVDDLDRKTMHALQYAKTIQLGGDPCGPPRARRRRATELRARSGPALGVDVPLDVVRDEGDPPSAIAGYVAALPQDADVNVDRARARPTMGRPRAAAPRAARARRLAQALLAVRPRADHARARPPRSRAPAHRDARRRQRLRLLAAAHATRWSCSSTGPTAPRSRPSGTRCRSAPTTSGRCTRRSTTTTQDELDRGAGWSSASRSQLDVDRVLGPQRRPGRSSATWSELMGRGTRSRS